MMLAFGDPRPLLLLPILGLLALAFHLTLSEGASPLRRLRGRVAFPRSPLGPRAGRRGLGLRWLVLALLLLAAARPRWGQTERVEPVLLAVEAGASQDLLQQVEALQERYPQLVGVGYDQDVRPLSPATRAAGGTPSLGRLLDFADRFFPDEGTLVLAGGGRSVDSSRVPDGLRILFWPQQETAQAEAAVLGFQAPGQVWQGEAFRAQLEVQATDAGQARLRVWADEQPLTDRQVSLQPGRQRFPIEINGSRPGLVTLRAQLTAGWDGRPENNEALAAVVVQPPPPLLLVGRPAPGFQSRLEAQDFRVDALPAEALPSELARLGGYGAIVLNDVSAKQLSLDQAEALEQYVASLGGGLLAAGGQTSFALGEYAGSRLEEVLPVRSEPPPQEEVPPLAMLIILDRSASMGRHETLSKMALAREAAILATELLQPQDQIGVLAFNTDTDWVVPLQTVGEELGLAHIQDEIARIRAGGGTDIRSALREGFGHLLEVDEAIRHVVLLTDGQDFSRRLDLYQELVTTARAAGITVSALAMGGDADVELLSHIAEWGNGRYYFAASPEDIPRLTLEESSLVTRLAVREGSFQADVASPHGALHGLAPADLPALGGYLATTPRQDAQVALASPLEDPVLAFRRVGLGRSAAWLSDLAGPWSEGWAGWEGAGPFWGQVIRSLLPRPGTDLLEAEATFQRSSVRIEVRARSDSDEPVDLAPPGGILERQGGGWQEVALAQVGAGRYRLLLEDVDPGVYALRLQQRRGGDTVHLTLPLAVPEPQAYRVPEVGPDDVAALARASGGAVVRSLDDLEPYLKASPGRTWELWPTLLLLAALLLPLESLVTLLRRRNYN